MTRLSGLKGHRVAVVEAGPLRGREQEWNISQDELDKLVELGVLTAEEVEEAVTTAFPGCRAGFKNEEGERKRNVSDVARRPNSRTHSNVCNFTPQTCLVAQLPPKVDISKTV